MNPADCPRFDKCSAPICPLDEHWRQRPHLEGERVCFWLTEASKRGGSLHSTPGVPDDIGKAVGEVYSEVVSRHGPIRRELRRAAKKGSRLEADQRTSERMRKEKAAEA